MNEVFDQGTDERIPVTILKVEMFLAETSHQSIISASEVHNLLLDILIELKK